MFAAIDLVYLLIGGLLGAAVGFLLRGWRQEIPAELNTQIALGQQRQEELSKQLEAEKSQTDQLRQRLSTAEQEAAALNAKVEAERQNSLQQRRLLDEAQAKLPMAFASVSAEALKQNNEAFLQLARERFSTITAEANGALDQRKEQIAGIVKPLQDALEVYQARIREIEQSRTESHGQMKEQLGALMETERTLKLQTAQLVTALSRPTVRGQWGEISLRRLVELAGMTARCDFTEQKIVETDEGRLRPDMVVNLPGGRDVVIDCKTPLDAFLDAASASDEEIRKGHLQRHAQQVRMRGRELSAKNYWSQFKNSPDFVVMFLPGEAFLYAAMEYEPQLVEDCLKSQVVIATPTTLLALLKTISYGWRQELMTQNTEQIRQAGADLYERLCSMMGHLNEVSRNLTRTITSFNQAMGSLETRVLPKARKMGELGVAGAKELDETKPVDAIPREIIPALFASES